MMHQNGKGRLRTAMPMLFTESLIALAILGSVSSDAVAATSVPTDSICQRCACKWSRPVSLRAASRRSWTQRSGQLVAADRRRRGRRLCDRIQLCGARAAYGGRPPGNVDVAAGTITGVLLVLLTPQAL